MDRFPLPSPRLWFISFYLIFLFGNGKRDNDIAVQRNKSRYWILLNSIYWISFYISNVARKLFSLWPNERLEFKDCTSSEKDYPLVTINSSNEKFSHNEERANMVKYDTQIYIPLVLTWYCEHNTSLIFDGFVEFCSLNFLFSIQKWDSNRNLSSNLNEFGFTGIGPLKMSFKRKCIQSVSRIQPVEIFFENVFNFECNLI